MTTVLQEGSGDSDEELLYEFVRNADGTVTKITKRNSNGRKCSKCGCRCPCSCADCRPFCCSYDEEEVFRLAREIQPGF